VFGTPDSHSEDPGLVLGACAIYPDDIFFHLCSFVCLFLPFTITSSRKILQYYLQTTTVSFMILPLDAVKCAPLKVVLTELGKKCQVLYFGVKHSLLVASICSLSTWHCGAVLGPWAYQHARKWNRRQASKGLSCCSTWAFLGGSLGRI